MSRTRIPFARAEEQVRLMAERLEMSTAEIGLTVRATNCLKERGILTVRDMLNATPEQLLSIATFGEMTLEEVYKAMEQIGFFHASRRDVVAGSVDWDVEVGGLENRMERVGQRNTAPQPSKSLAENEVVPAGLAQSLSAFRRDLNDLLREHPGKWVAYHHDRRIGLSDSKSRLYDDCLQRGLAKSEFIVRRVVPDVNRCVEERPL